MQIICESYKGKVGMPGLKAAQWIKHTAVLKQY